MNFEEELRNTKQDGVPEDELPALSDEEKAKWLAQSHIVDGIRVGPPMGHRVWFTCPVCLDRFYIDQKPKQRSVDIALWMLHLQRKMATTHDAKRPTCKPPGFVNALIPLEVVGITE